MVVGCSIERLTANRWNQMTRLKRQEESDQRRGCEHKSKEKMLPKDKVKGCRYEERELEGQQKMQKRKRQKIDKNKG